MAGVTERSYRVSFPSEGRKVTVPEGTSLLEACQRAGIPIDAVCSGEGKCGRCKVRPVGEYRTERSSLISSAESKEGFVLACLTTVHGDLDVEISQRAKLSRHQILTRTVADIPKPLSPWVRRASVELQPPTLSDNVADLERVMRGLSTDRLCIPLEMLGQIPEALRKGGWKATVTISELEKARDITRIEPGNWVTPLLGIAVDIGTTTVVVELVDLSTGTVLETAAEYNRQTSRGEDVIARMMFSEEKGVTELKHLVRETINLLISQLLADLRAKAGRQVDRSEIVAASVAGNTIMIHFFLGLDTKHLRVEPYVPVAYHMPCAKASEVGLEIDPAARVLMFPSRAGYVGGDVVADILASGIHRSPRPRMLIDVGTNGEIVLGGRDWMVSCSCSAGPAFEGGEVSCGMRAMDGAIDKIRLNDDLTTTYHVIGDGPPAGICGSGLIDLMAEMYAKGVIDRKGRIQDLTSQRIRRSDSGLEFLIESRTKMGPYATADMTIGDGDLQNLMRTKAAIFGACSVLLRKTGQSLEKVANIVIAGGFGFHLDIARAITLGMFPDVPQSKYRFIGNGSLAGARMALLSGRRRKEMNEIFEMMTYLELSVDNEFYDEFSAALFIPHTDISRFPSATGGTPQMERDS